MALKTDEDDYSSNFGWKDHDALFWGQINFLYAPISNLNISRENINQFNNALEA